MPAKSEQPVIPSKGEELAGSISHGIGALLGTAGLVILVVLASMRGDALKVVSFSLYGSTLVFMFVASTLYHGFRKPGLKKVFRIIDHSSIYLLIAGTYTPYMLIAVKGALGWTVFGIIWGLALIGMMMKMFLIGRSRILSPLIYIGMGWLSVVTLGQLRETLSFSGMVWLVTGGVSYTLGVVFYAMKKIPWSHTVWHMFVLAGALCHFFGILFHLLP